MPKSQVELSAIEFAKKRLRKVYGEEPEEMPEGHGYDLRCGKHCVEVKGMASAAPGFCFFTHGTFRAAQEQESFEVWLVTDALRAPTLHIVSREAVLRTMKLEVQWILPLGKRRLEQCRAS